ncbi:MAG: YggT family protein [Vallitaleaceae bacterium]|nr:YggT family protein [Vallitaleaceae bacterium]
MEKITLVRSKESKLKLRKSVSYILGILEVLFAFRLIFKLLGANPESVFVSLIYTVSGVFLAPFNGIFRAAVNDGIETQSVLEPMTIIAMIVYALVAYGVVRLIEIYETPKNKAV